ncbi:putative monooxygenase [Hypoxylon trugodes]|uniref:putative monooxygenase n=1 Tax=Hypoxylon trugodes TaxID=326681 RepID=UPI0021A0A28E|nr:putative monooxygenase [Hypoxylon trugodes]KAI1391902.1 putative monooxygenase [Hypoxylon trugodes]
MANVDADVLIIGGGIGGLTLAAIVRRLGLSCKVLERTEVLSPVGAGISLAPNALALLDQIGIYQDILKTAQPLKTIQITRNDTLWQKLDFSTCEATFGYPVLSAERHNFHRLLYNAAGGEETVILNSKVTNIIDDPNSSVVTVVVDGGKELRGRLVIGADGIRSVTRRILAGSADDKAANTIKFTGRVHMSGITAPLKNCGKEELGVANWLLYDDSILTTWPCIENRQWFIGVMKADSAPRDRSVWAGTTPDMIKDVYGEKFHPFAESKKFSEIVDQSERVLASNVFAEVEFPSMSKGRVALVGDAAHSMTSFFGQGACQAIEDAAVLGNLLNEWVVAPKADFNKFTHKDLSLMLYEYSERRKQRVQDLAKFSADFARLHTANLPFGLGPLVRKLVYSYVPSWVWIWYLRWLYGVQPTVAGLKDLSEKKAGSTTN